MMSRDPDRRPGVKQLLELPSVQRAVKRRYWQLMWAKILEMMIKLYQMMLPLLKIILSLITSIGHPIKHFISQLQATPPSTPPAYLTTSHHSSNIDCFSDDDADVTVSSSGSSLAAPLDSSTSDRCSRLTSTPHISTHFFSPETTNNISVGGVAADSWCYSPMRRPATSPGPMRARARFLARTPGGASPGIKYLNVSKSSASDLQIINVIPCYGCHKQT